jgi:hypothetical protein
LEAIDEMTPEQAHDLEIKLAKRQWNPVPGGFFDRFAFKVSMAAAHTDGFDLSSANLSSGRHLDLEDVGGYELSFLWQLFDKRFRAGFKVAAMAAEDSHMGPGGYSRAEVSQATSAVVANYQLIRSDSLLWWTEAAIGGSHIELELLDTPLGSASTIHHYEKNYGQGEFSTGVDWRFNPMLSLGGFIGYRYAKDVDLEEGGRKTGASYDPKGFKGGVGLTYNF